MPPEIDTHTTHTHTHSLSLTHTHTHTHTHTPAVFGIYTGIGAALKTVCIALNKLCIVLVIPEEDGANTPFNKVCLVFMVIYLLTLAAQDDQINAFKCGCKQIDDLTFAKRCAVGPQAIPLAVDPGQDPFCPPDTQCFGGYCTSSWAGLACTNPYANPLTKAIAVSHSMTDSEEEWETNRNNMCFFGNILHLVLLGWGGFFFTELVIRFIGHQVGVCVCMCVCVCVCVRVY